MCPPLDRVKVMNEISFVLRQKIPIFYKHLFFKWFQIFRFEISAYDGINIFYLILIRNLFFRIHLILSFQKIESFFKGVNSASFIIRIINLKAIIKITLNVVEKELILYLLSTITEFILKQDRIGKFGKFDFQETCRNQTVCVIQFYIQGFNKSLIMNVLCYYILFLIGNKI